MKEEEYFDLLIASIEGVVVSDEEIIYVMKVDKGIKWVATLEKNKGISFFWASWPVFYEPLMTKFKMTEDQIAEFIQQKLKVDLVGFMPSVQRVFKEQLEMSENDFLLESPQL